MNDAAHTPLRRLSALAGALCALGAFAAPAAASAQQSPREDATLVTVDTVRREELAPSLAAAGTVFSRHEAQITAGLLARLAWIAEPGDFIAAGEPVARFDCALLELEHEQQEVIAEREGINAGVLERETERLRTLHASSNASATQLDRMQADWALARNALQLARVQLRHAAQRLTRCVAGAPFSGVVTERLHRPGEDVERGAVLARMADTRNLEVRANVPVRHLPRVLVGSQAEVDIGGLLVQATLRSLVPAADVQSQTFQARLDLPASAHDFVAAGQLVNLRLPLASKSALTVPRDAVILREDGAFVMRISDRGEAQQVSIELADAQGGRVAVNGELSPGDTIAVRGAESLSDGQRVAVHGES